MHADWQDAWGYGGGDGAAATLVVYDATAAPVLAAVTPAAGGLAEPTSLTLRGTNFAPLPGLTCAIGDARAPATFVDASHVACVAPASGVAGSVWVSLSSDGAAPSSNRIRFTYYDLENPARTIATQPSSCALDGQCALTLQGANLAPTGALACVWFPVPTEGAPPGPASAVAAATFVDASLVRCRAPAWRTPETTMLAVTLDTSSVDTAALAATGAVHFTFYDAGAAPLVTGLSTHAAPLRGTPHLVTMHGVNFAPTGEALLCRHGDAPSSWRRATFVDSATLRCPVDASGEPRTAPLSASSDGGRTWSVASSAGAADFTLYDPLAPPVATALEPPYAPAAERVLVNVTGRNFAPTAGLACWFGSSRAARVIFIDSTTLRCEAAPAAAPTDQPVRVTLSGDAPPPNATAAPLFGRYDISRPPRTDGGGGDTYGDIHAAVNVSVLGTNFAPDGLPLACELRALAPASTPLAHTVVPARFVSNREAVCELPPMDSPVTLLLRVRRAVGASDGAGHRFTLYDRHRPPFLASLDPASAPCGVESTITVRGRNFAPTGEQALVCSFQYLYDEALVDAPFVSSTEITCALPGNYSADAGYSLQRATFVAVSHDGITFGDAWARFVYTGGCVPEATTSVALCVILLFVVLICALLYQDHARRQQLLRARRLLKELQSAGRTAKAAVRLAGAGAKLRPSSRGFDDGADEAEGRSLLKVGAPRSDQLPPAAAAFPEPPSLAGPPPPPPRRMSSDGGRERSLSASGPVLLQPGQRRAGPRLISAGGGGAGRRAGSRARPELQWWEWRVIAGACGGGGTAAAAVAARRGRRGRGARGGGELDQQGGGGVGQ